MLLNGRADDTGSASDVVVQRFRQVGHLRSNVSRQAIDPNNIGDLDMGLLGHRGIQIPAVSEAVLDNSIAPRMQLGACCQVLRYAGKAYSTSFSSEFP
jgi:hypothetical protein